MEAKKLKSTFVHGEIWVVFGAQKIEERKRPLKSWWWNQISSFLNIVFGTSRLSRKSYDGTVWLLRNFVSYWVFILIDFFSVKILNRCQGLVQDTRADHEICQFWPTAKCLWRIHNQSQNFETKAIYVINYSPLLNLQPRIKGNNS